MRTADALRRLPLLLLLALPSAAEEPKPPDHAKEIAFARAFAEEVGRGDLPAALARIDWDALLDRALRDAGSDATFEEGFRRGFKKSQKEPGRLFPTLVAAVKAGGSFTFLKVRERGGETRALFRFVREDGGFNYYDCLLAAGKDGRPRVADLHVFLAAEDFSATLRRQYLPIANEYSKGFLEKLLTSESEFVKSIPELDRMGQLQRGGEPAAALAIFRKLPESVRKEKSVLLLRLQAAQEAGEAEHLAAIADFRNFHPEEACIDMLMIDAHAYAKRFDEAIACVERVDAMVEGDPYTDLLRGNLLWQKGDAAGAKRAGAEAIAAEPTLADAYWFLISIAVGEKDYAETARLLTEVERRCRAEIADLRKIDAYKGFVESPEYEKWLRRER